MGLDLSIRQQIDVKQNEKGQWTWQVIEIGNYRNVWDFVALLDIENCTTKSFYGKELKENIKNLENEQEKEILQELLEILDNNEFYEVHAWW